MHLAFRVQSEEFLIVTRIKLRDVSHQFLFRIPNFGGARFPFFCERQDKARNQPHKGPRKFYEARYRFILSFEKTDFVNDVLLAGTR
ncbi:hypothetical protein ALC60_01795 [Trachymyrmex zeteki]|uniref:Uncharacterized protein n=1 Tax=Mycetomoellerius zeteki TaxID=64791 RepID=A0A151XFR0_9HYME|nr:hypothetical protein ALC60_01795 [Trachymyrmex zeteki]